MLKVLRPILSSALAFLVLLSTVSWTVDKHLCMGRVMDIALFHNADSCGMEEAMALMDETAIDMDCCDDESFTIEGQDDLKLTWEEIDLDSQYFILVFTNSYYDLLLDTSKSEVQKTCYPPPLLVHDLQVLHEVFLI